MSWRHLAPIACLLFGVACSLYEQMQKECDLEDADEWCNGNRSYECVNKDDEGQAWFEEDCSKIGQVCIEVERINGLHNARCVVEELSCEEGYKSICYDVHHYLWGTCNDGVVLPEDWKNCDLETGVVSDCVVDTDTKSARCVPHDYDAGE